MLAKGYDVQTAEKHVVDYDQDLKAEGEDLNNYILFEF